MIHRRGLRILVMVTLIVVGIRAGGYLVGSLRSMRAAADAADAPRLEARLLADAVALTEGAAARPSHVAAPTPGSFGDAAAPHLTALEAGAAAWRREDQVGTDARKVRQAIVGGERPLADLPAPWQQALLRDGAAAQGLLAATHARTALGPPGLRVFRAKAGPARPRDDWGCMGYGGELAALLAREHLARGQSPAALALCVDGLALSRDLAYNGSLAMMLGLTNGALFLRTCGAALDVAPAAAKRAAAGQLLAIRAALSSFVAVYKPIAAFKELGFFGGVLRPEQQARLPAEAREVVTMSSGGRQPRAELQRRSLRAYLDLQGRMDQVMAVPPDERFAVVADLERKAPSLEPSLSGEASKMAGDAVTLAALRDQVDLLLTVAAVDLYHAEKGTWPPSPTQALNALAPLPGADGPTPLTPFTLTPEPQGHALRVAGPRLGPAWLRVTPDP